MERLLHNSQQMGLMELVAFMLSGVGQRETSEGQRIQIWQPAQPEPLVLFYANQDKEVSGSSSSRSREFAYNLLAVQLPRSGKLAWIPLVKSGYRDIDHEWEERFAVLDGQLVAKEDGASGQPDGACASATPAGLRKSTLRAVRQQASCEQKTGLGHPQKRTFETSWDQRNPRKRH